MNKVDLYVNDSNSFYNRTESVKRKMRFGDNLATGSPIHKALGSDFRTHREYLSKYLDVDSTYKIFFELIKDIPFLIQLLEDYFERYSEDLIRISGTAGLFPPRFIDRFIEKERDHFQFPKDNWLDDRNIYVTVEELGYNLTPYDPVQREVIWEIDVERYDDYIEIVCIVWLINLLRTNFDVTIGINESKHELPKQGIKFYACLQDLIEKLKSYFGNDNTHLILDRSFTLLGLSYRAIVKPAIEK